MKLSSLLLIASLIFCAATARAATTPGLSFSYFEGSWSTVPDFNLLTPVKTGTTPNISLDSRRINDNFGYMWQGYISIPAAGSYTFETVSDDGSKLYFNSPYTATTTPLVNNDGLHGAVAASGTVSVTAAGLYPITIVFFEREGDESMKLLWTGPGLAKQAVPDAAFTTPLAPASANGLSFSYFEGSWSTVPDFNLLTPVKTGTAPNISLDSRRINDNFGFMWQGYINIPAAGSYTFETVSDDGSKLYFNSPYSPSATPLVNNDGLHGAVAASGTVSVAAAGLYPITIVFFEREGDESMKLLWTGPGFSKQAVPDAAFTSTETGGLTGSTNFYFSSSSGDDTRTAAQAQNPNTPWKSVARINQLLAQAAPGTALLLKRGDAFQGALRFASSGSPSSPIILSAYGTGPKPIITGFDNNIQWTAAGNGIWQATLSTSIEKLNMVARASQIQLMGRFPNITEPNMGFLSIDSHSNTSADRNSVEAIYSHQVNSMQYITDAALPSSINWTGAELVIKKNRWTLDRAMITAHANSSLAYMEPSGMEPIDGFGYFIQNDPRTLDQSGEWYFNPTTKKLQVFSGSASPATLGIRASVTDTLITIRSQSNITIDNIALQGANNLAVAACDWANFLTIQNCAIDFSGINAITTSNIYRFSLINNTINHTNNNALYLAPNCPATLVKGNTVKNAGLIPGMGLGNNQTHEGLVIDGRGSLVQYNTFDSIGYVGIAITRDSVTVINNLVSNYALVTDDCGGIYTHDRGYYGRRIIGNIVLNGRGCHYGTDLTEDSDAQGIGLDDLSSFVEITGNSVANCSGKGISLHNSQNITIKGNTVFNNKTAQLEFDHDNLGPDSPTRNVVVEDNILFARTAEQPVLTILSKDNDATLFGTASNNYYCRPMDDALTFRASSYWGSWQVNNQYYDLSHWRGVSGQDVSSKKSPLSLASYTVLSSGANLIANGSFNSNIGGTMNPNAAFSTLSYESGVLDGGALKVAYTGSTPGTGKGLVVWFYDPANLQTLAAGKTYRLRFSVRGSKDSNTDFAATFYSSTGGAASECRVFKVYNTRREVELLYTPKVSVPAFYLTIYMQNADNCPVWWLDNVKVEEVSLSYTNPDDYMRFEYNASTAARTIALDGEWVDVKNQVYSGSVTLAAYSSAVLMRRTAGGMLQPQDQTQRAVASPAMSAATQEAAVAGKGMQVRVSPNPATDRIELSHGMQAAAGQSARVTVYNAGGGVVKSMTVSLGSAAVTLGVSELRAGVYTVRIESGAQSRTAQFVKL